MLKKVAFTMYPVKDLPRARAFYEGVLGLETSASDTTPWVEYDLPGGGCFAITTVTQGAPSADAGGTIAFEVDDLDGAVADLKGRDIPLPMDIIHSPVCRMAVCLDPDGNSILLHQLKPKEG